MQNCIENAFRREKFETTTKREEMEWQTSLRRGQKKEGGGGGTQERKAKGSAHVQTKKEAQKAAPAQQRSNPKPSTLVSGSATFVDLCPGDKQRVARLITELAQLSKRMWQPLLLFVFLA